MAKKKNKNLIRPWCWYCEREFEDEKVLMQHQKAKHFRCNMCPRRLNTAGGLAVHIQQVHKLEPENLPRIDNALPGRDGYEVEIFGMEGIPAPDVADYKRRKEIELGLAAGSISQPQAKRPRTENRPMSEEELKAALTAHKALMSGGAIEAPLPPADSSNGGIYNAGPTAYAAPPVPLPPGQPPMMPPPGMMPPGGPPFMPPPPGYPMPMPPGAPVPPGFPMPPPFLMPPGGMPPPGMPQLGMPPAGMPPPYGVPPGMPGMPPRPSFPPAAPPTFVPQQHGMGSPFPPPTSGSPVPPGPTPPSQTPPVEAPRPVKPTLPNPKKEQTNPPFKKETDLKFKDANFSPEELRAYDPKYYVEKTGASEEARGKKRARAEDFL